MKKRILSPTQALAAGYAGIVLLGTALLLLPAASRDGRSIPFLSALFTATSASCVTGLSLYDTWTQFSLFGQAVLLGLIQLGGLGFMTVVIAVALIMRRRIGLRHRSILAESIGTGQLAGIVKLARRILAGTALLEGVGAAVLATRFVPLLGWRRGLWFALFHAVSAFCNAGFDLMGALAPSSSLSYFRGDPVVLLSVSVLILTGGIGFLVWNDLAQAWRERRGLCLHTRLTLLVTGALTVLGTGLMLLAESESALRGMGAGEKLLNAFFLSVTPRTAGFSAVNPDALSGAGKALTILLMFIGAAPGGTGGGVKVTTFAVVLLSLTASLRRREETSVGKYRLDEKTVGRAYSSFLLFLFLITAGTLTLCLNGVELTAACFECVSALATVGLTVGVTPALPPLSQLVVIALMYAGRVGGLTIFLAMSRRSGGARLKNAIGKVIVG